MRPILWTVHGFLHHGQKKNIPTKPMLGNPLIPDGKQCTYSLMENGDILSKNVGFLHKNFMTLLPSRHFEIYFLHIYEFPPTSLYTIRRNGFETGFCNYTAI
jgi:hypothetical protein